MFRGFLLALVVAAHAQAADTREQSCGYEAQVASAIQRARIERVQKGEVMPLLLADTPPWPEAYNAAIPQLTEYVYQQKIRDLKQIDLGQVLLQQCIDNWDQIQEMQKQLRN